MKKNKKIIGSVEMIKLPEVSDKVIYARIDTGAKTSSISAQCDEIDGRLKVHFIAFGGYEYWFDDFDTTVVASSNGQAELRYKVKLRVVLASRIIRAHFTLTDRSTQVYPALVGRNVLHGKFIVDVTQGTPLLEEENARSQQLQERISE